MKNKVDQPITAAELRRKAEEKARGNTSPTREALSPDETRQTLQELRVHQIELEMQNEELRRAQAELDAARARYFDLYNLAPVGYVTLSEQGLILEGETIYANRAILDIHDYDSIEELNPPRGEALYPGELY